jgi:hypothetical protein
MPTASAGFVATGIQGLADVMEMQFSTHYSDGRTSDDPFVEVDFVGVTSVAYRDSYPDTIMTRVKSVPLLPCWTWTVFLIFMFWSGALVCQIL